MHMKLSQTDIEAAVLGGAVLGGGGGGALENGRALAALAFEHGSVDLLSIDEVSPDAVLVTCSYVGSPAAEHICVPPGAYLQAVEMLRAQAGISIGGLITNECGGTATVNGWLQAAALGLPLVDAPCNGRAHPTGLMGAMGLHAMPGYVSHQAAAGGDEKAGRSVALYVQASLETASAMVRQAAVQAGGMVAVARNPVQAGYVRQHGAPGAIRLCLALGKAMLAAVPQGGMAVSQAAADFLNGEVISAGVVDSVSLHSEGGFDVGKLRIGEYELDFWNEYMTLEKGSERLATFPDLIMTLSVSEGMPVTTAAAQQGQHLAILHAPRQRLILGAGMHHRELYEPAERVLGKRLW
jgi:DUF917 family protein